MMPMMSWMSFAAWFTLLLVLLTVAGIGALIAFLLAQHSGTQHGGTQHGGTQR
jgi:hypothetical protein